MNDDQINKVETIIGYLDLLLSKRTPVQNAADEIQAVADEAREWIQEERAKFDAQS